MLVLMFDLASYMTERRQIVDGELDARLPPGGTRPRVLHEAMRYGVLSGGKRLRPILCMAAAEAAGAPWQLALTPALAVELVHSYTLIHDDLPCMDDDDLRRGRPTVHKVYGEAQALLAGSALLTLAFEWLAGTGTGSPSTAPLLVAELAHAAGSQGVLGGQVEDIGATAASATPELVDYIHAHKTADLIKVSVVLGAIAGAASESDAAALARYGERIGLAFQAMDDILNATGTREQTGKPAGSDATRGKATCVAVLGLKASRERAEQLTADALRSLRPLKGRVEPLEALARFTVERSS